MNKNIEMRVSTLERMLRNQSDSKNAEQIIPNNIRLFAFQLNEDMTVNGADSDIFSLNLQDTIALGVNVKNTLGDFSDMVNDDYGICARVNGVYYAIHPDGGGQTDAHIVTLTSALAVGVGNTATANVTVSGEADVTVGTGITIYNTGDFRGPIGASAFVIKVAGQYWVVHINQNALIVIATLSNDTHDISVGYAQNATAARQQTITTASFQATSAYPFSFVPSPAPTIRNPYNILAFSGEELLVSYNSVDNTWDALGTFPVFPRVIRFKLNADWPNGHNQSVTTATTVQPSGDSYTQQFFKENVSGSFSLRDSYNLAYNAKNGDEGIAVYDFVQNIYEIVSIEHVATRWRGYLTSGFSGGASSFTVTPEKGLDGPKPSGNQTVYNIYNWDHGDMNDKILVYWNPEDGQYEAMQMECPA